MNTGLYNDLHSWAESRGLYLSTRDRRDGYGHSVKLTIDGSVTVNFRSVPPLVVVECDDDTTGVFINGLPSAALIGLVAGFLSVYAEPATGPAESA